MKTNFRFSLLVIAGCFLFAACSKDVDQPEGDTPEQPSADYTIIMYGCGGDNLDDYMLYNLEQVAGYGYSSQVQFVAKIKFSKPYQKSNSDSYGGTRLYTLTEQGMTNERVGSQGYRMDDPQNLADFITASKKEFPAKQYILILWNHGSSFDIRDQLVDASYPEKVAVDSRGLVFDDNTNESLSIFEQEEAYRRADVKLDMIYWDVCLMNTIENLCQIKDYTRYVLGAGHLTPGLGGNYASLMHSLESNSDLLKAMQEYVPATVDHWVSVEGADDGKDLTLCDMQYVDEVAQNIGSCTSGLIAYRDGLEPGSKQELLYHYLNGTKQTDDGKRFPYYSKGGVLYFFDNNYASVDMFSAFTRIENSLLDGKLSAQITKLKLAVDKMIPIGNCAGTPKYLKSVSVGINWMDKNDFEQEYSPLPIKTYEGLYTHLRFEQIAKWSHFLKTNIRKTVSIRKNPETGEEELYEVTKEPDME